MENESVAIKEFNLFQKSNELMKLPEVNTNQLSPKEHDLSGKCQKMIYVSSHYREGKLIQAYQRKCGQKHTALDIMVDRIVFGPKPFEGQEHLLVSTTNGIETNIDIPSVQNSIDNATWNIPLETKEDQFLLFDGENLTLYENGEMQKQWAGVSGQEGYQEPQFQGKRDLGPIPEGNYVLPKSEYQNWWRDTNFIEKSAGLLNKGPWPNLPIAWGTERVWMNPSNETNTYGRSGFSVHGGLFPGSAGCIDLTGQMNSFADWFIKNDSDVFLHVKY
ncbi:MAG: DUF2778 domain-containing protein [Alphaproteobacteria bacterium]|nr:DUF2778 domain-containing protein [Alphaproteobacteria bacterium]